MPPDCHTETIGLLLLSLALLISMCLNVIICMGRRTTLRRSSCCSAHIYEGEGRSEDEGHYFQDFNHHELQENPHNHHEQQENPIYGNIHTNRRVSVEVCYEMMTKRHTRDLTKPLESDLNYASLDLKLAKKRKKHRHQQPQAQGRNNREDQLPVPFPASANAFLEVEGDMDAHLPPRDNSTMVSQSSIYLNSQQIAQEAEEMDRERSMNMEREDIDWEGTRRQDDCGNREWKGEQENEESKDDSNGTVCTQISEIQAIQSGTDHFVSSFSHEGDQ
ncbi:uncharacterized protein LOC113142998 [Mastacembelus armatus]|uniref:uncharacterized protein LOC113142998 n=1 Tax=Mastacembelus armatus TaxID=205130 RepID=UPI000E45D227|nr:uncharacterized protein LOC113142998 [Mastacembelus armatus]